jgi:pyruvate dehydrogenase E2 component (dihydrolipoamide acetyltransferase)
MAQLTMTTSVDAQLLDSVRDKSAAEGDSARPTYTELIIAHVARTLPEHPELNATLEDDIKYEWASVNIGMAVALEQGLIVPVIKEAQTLSLRDIMQECRRLGERARRGELDISEITNATFTVTNLGAFGIDTFTPIIDPPQVAILGVGRVLAGRMAFSLTIDHQAVDGAPGAAFLRALADAIEHVPLSP